MILTAKQLQIGLAGLLVAGIGAAALALVFASKSGISSTADDDPLEHASRIEVEQLLNELKRAWRPVDRARTLEAARPRTNFLAPGLRYFLTQPERGLTDGAIEVAGKLQVLGTHPELVVLTASGPPERRAAALIAVEAIRPWPVDQLSTFLHFGDAEVRLAALTVSLARDDVPWLDVFEPLLAVDPDMLAAAVEKLPRALPDAAIDALLELSDLADAATAVSIVRILGSREPDDRTEPALTRFLIQPDAAVATATLTALATKSSPLDNAEAVWAVAIDVSRDDAVRARAMHCLERTESYDAGELHYTAASLPPLARYFAARCLLQSGERNGVDLLLGLLGGATDPETALDQMSTLRTSGTSLAAHAARRLLTSLSGSSPGTSVERLRDWFLDPGNEWNDRHLPAAPSF